MKFFKKKRKVIRASNAVDVATTRACWGKKLHGYPGIAGKGGATTNSRINEWMFEKELKEYKEGTLNA